MTQDALAEEMQKLGFAYHQATIYKIENGHRKTPVTEALSLAKVLGYSVEALSGGEDQIAATALEPHTQQLQNASNQLYLAVRGQVDALLAVTKAADEAGEALTERDRAWLSSGLFGYTPANLASEGFFLMDARIAIDMPGAGEWTHSTLTRLHSEYEAIERVQADG